MIWNGGMGSVHRLTDWLIILHIHTKYSSTWHTRWFLRTLSLPFDICFFVNAWYESCFFFFFELPYAVWSFQNGRDRTIHYYNLIFTRYYLSIYLYTCLFVCMFANHTHIYILTGLKKSKKNNGAARTWTRTSQLLNKRW